MRSWPASEMHRLDPDTHGKENVGRSSERAAALDPVRLTGTTDANVAIFGKTGAGRERKARSSHSMSARASSPTGVMRE
jgi:transcriptional regulator with GAF, ATPase, and Fis domain